MKYLVLLFVLNFNAIQIDAIALSESDAGQFIASIGRIEKVPGISFRATQTAEEFESTGHKSLNKLSYTRIVTGTLSPKGFFRFEIEYTEGNSIGQKYTVCFNGERSFFVNTKGNTNFLITEKGKTTMNPFLFYANAIVEPFAFLSPNLLDPEDQGSYMTLADLVNKKIWEEWLSNSKLEASGTNEIQFLEREITSIRGGKKIMIVEVGSSDFLPKKITYKTRDNKIIEKRVINWQDVTSINNGNYILPKHIEIEKYAENGNKVIITTNIEEIKIASDITDSVWSYDISKATSIYDVNEKLLIPQNKSK
jgi:hypothetical protein